eukprot:m.369871 g.369871  ORF g.369871 m.369871 type:complete len:54 (+) comp56119_c1_seq18:530-691(+)
MSSPAAVERFLAHGADASLRNQEGNTALELAQVGRKEEIVRLLQGKPPYDRCM